MDEKLEIYDLQSKLLYIQNRKEFYEEIKTEYKKTGKITKKVKIVRLLLLNSQGRIYLQKRSKIKTENSGLYDKTIGGHVPAGFSYDMTLIKECAEELGFPAAILSSDDYEEAIKVTPLDIIGLFRKVDYRKDLVSTRIIQDKTKFIQPYICTFYIGHYDGAIKFRDGESSGIEVFSLPELKQDIKKFPNKFTEDIKTMIGEFKNFLIPR